MADWLHVIYQASDAVHYGLFAASVEVSDEHILRVVYPPGTKEDDEAYERELSSMDLFPAAPEKGSAGGSADRLLGVLDAAFSRDLGFTLERLLSALYLLSNWASIRPGTSVAPTYAGSREDVIVTLGSALREAAPSELQNVVDFLTLRAEDVCRVLGDPHADEIPIWEHRKRPWRYTLRPLIRIHGLLHWSPYSTEGTARLWSRCVRAGILPAELCSPNVSLEMETIKRTLGEALVDETMKVVAAQTQYARKNAFLTDIDKGANHPEDLGDYDVLAYLPAPGIALSIECKDLGQVFCAKDSRRLRDRIFGREDEGHFRQVRRRGEYLAGQCNGLFARLGWLPVQDKITVVSLYVTRSSYWWTKYPPWDPGCKLLRIDELPEFLAKL